MNEFLKLWTYHESLTINEAVFLIIGINPSDAKHHSIENYPDQYSTILSLIIKAIGKDKLKAKIETYQIGYERPEIDCDESIIEVNDLKEWLSSINLKPKFFFSETNLNTPDYLNKDHPRYSEKLAACINTWVALEDQSLTNGKSVKSAIDSYLIKNSIEFGLVHKHDDPKHSYKKGDITKGAKDEMIRIINWNPIGGATKAREINKPTPQDTEPTPQFKHVDIIKDFDDIPF